MERAIVIGPTGCLWIRCARILVIIALSFGGPGCSKADAPATAAPGEYRQGETLFKSNCAKCHGEGASGTDQGPPLVHKVYEPNHHADIAFQRAAANGVRAHHWKFGDMPKIDGVSPPEVEQIIAYVRWLQRQAGIQ